MAVGEKPGTSWQFFRKTFYKAHLAVQAGLFFLWVPFLIKVFSLPRLLKLLDYVNIAPFFLSTERFTASEHAALFSRVIQFLPNYGIGKCLLRSVLLYGFLPREFTTTTLVIGVHLHQGQLSSHSWIEVNGEPIAEPANPTQVFKVLYRYTRKRKHLSTHLE